MAKLSRSFAWRVGQRVARKNSDELGTIVEADAQKVKVKWDGGKTSYFRIDKLGNVKLAEPPN
jgi:hypothetical protein